MTRAARVGFAALAVLAACDDAGLDPATEITAPRVLAITTEPSALPLDGELALATLTVDPDGPRLGIGAEAPVEGRPVDAVRMRACAPWKFITDPSRDCAGDDALSLALDASGRVVTSAAELEAAFPSPPGTPAPPDPWRAAIAAGVTLRVPIIAEVEVDGQTLIARRDVDVVDPTVQRRNPRVAELRFGGISTPTLHTGTRYELTASLDPASLDEAQDAEASGALETVVCHFYVTTGELGDAEAPVEDPAALAPVTTPTSYTAGRPGTAWLFVIATDETGGLSATSLELAIE